MATQYSPKLKLALPVQGELSGTWGDVVNDNITSMIEEAIAGLASIGTWTANAHVLTTADGTTAESRAAMLVLADGAGLAAAGTVTCPTLSKVYIVKNGTSYAVTLKTVAGTGVAIPVGATMMLFCDGTNVVEALNRVTGAFTVGGTLGVAGAATFSSTVAGAFNGTLGATTPASIAATTLTSTGAVTINTNVSYIGVAGSGTGGNWRYLDDSGAQKWLTGMLGSPGERAFTIYDLVNGTAPLTINGSTGAATFSSSVTVGSNLTMPAGGVIYLDGGGDTFLREVAANTVQLNTAGVVALTIDGSQAATFSAGVTALRLASAGDYLSNGGDISLTNTNGGRGYRIGEGVGGFIDSLVFWDSTTAQPRFRIDSTGAATFSNNISLTGTVGDIALAPTSSLAKIDLAGTGAVGYDRFRIQQGVVGISNSGMSIYDLDAAATRLVMDSAGNLLVGASTASGSGASSGKFVSQFLGTAGNGVYIDDTNTAAGTDTAVIFGRGATITGSITTTLTTTAYVTTSDPRVKSTFVEPVGALAKVVEARESGATGVFYFLAEPDVPVLGYNAHKLLDLQPGFGGTEGTGPRGMELGEVYELAVIDEDGNEVTPAKTVQPAGVDQSKRVPLLEAAIYELLQRIEALTARLDAAGL